MKAPERMVYINGQDYPAPAFALSAAALTQYLRQAEWLMPVALGLSHGERAGKRETWIAYVRRHVGDHMFHK